MEERYGRAPLNDIENFSLWLTGLSPLTEEEKIYLLLSKNTKERLERCVQRLSQYIHRINQRKQLSDMLTQAGSTIFTSAGTAIRNMVSFMTNSSDREDSNSSSGGSGGDELVGDDTNTHDDEEEEYEMQQSHENGDTAVAQTVNENVEMEDSESTSTISQQGESH
jgi:hypothetical protein